MDFLTSFLKGNFMKEENAIVKKGTDAAFEMFEALGQVVGVYVNKHLKNLPEVMMQLMHQLQQVETKQQQFQYDINSLKQQLEVMTSMNNLLENAGKTNHLLSKQHYDEHIIQPLTRSVLPVFDIIEDAGRRCEKDPKTADIFDALLSQLQQFLAVYDVKVIRHSTNDKFDPRQMKPIKWIPTPNREQDGLVAQSMQIGFGFSNERMLRLETVALFKYQQTEIQPNNLNQGAEQC